MHVILTFGLLAITTNFAFEESEISYCTNYKDMCNPDYPQPCCDQSLKCSLVNPEGKYRCVKQVGLGETCYYDSDCSRILWLAHCSSEKKCACRSDAIKVGQGCEALIGGFCIHNEQCTPENSICSNKKCKCSHRFVPVAHNLCIRATLGVPCLDSMSCLGIKNAVCSSDVCSCRPGTMKVSSTMCGKFLDNSCEQDDDCGPENSICVDNRCKCSPKFFREGNTQCNPLQLNMPCTTYTDCNSLIKHSLCSKEQKCKCLPTYFPINETTCVPYHGLHCSDNDPCVLENSFCVHNFCRCAPHYSYIGLKCEPTFLDKPCEKYTDEDTGSCKSLLEGSCFKNSDCYVENSLCVNNKCQCKINFAADFNYRCVSKLTMSCNDDDECKRLYFQKCFTDMKNTFSSRYTAMNHFECKLELGNKCTQNEQCTPDNSRCIDRRCQCKPKFMRSEAGDECVSIYSSKKCNTHDECDYIQNGMCSNDNICVCETNHERIDENICLPLLGQYCDRNIKCATDNAVCADHICTCDIFFSQQSINRCLPTSLQQPCKLNDDCKHIKYAECSKNKKCACSSNYIELNKVACAPFLGGYCESNEECFVNQTKCIENKCVHVQNVRPRVVKPQPPSSTRKCQNDGDCLSFKNSICFANGECSCKPHYILVNRTLCLPLLNEDCSNSSCAVDNSWCLHNECLCANYFIQHSNDKCLPTRLNEPCKIDADCREIRNAVCSKKKTCVCQEYFSQFSLTRCTSLSEEFCWTNDDCPVANSACINNFCQCKPDFENLYDNQCVPQIAIQPCSSDRDCMDISNSFCSNRKCTCKPNYVALNTTTCLIRFSGSCHHDEDCTKMNGFCFYGQCLCRPNHDIVSDKCVPISLGGSCRTILDCNSIPNAVCSADNKCICTASHYAKDKFSCLPKLGSECSNISPCDFGNSECFQGSSCQCQQGYYAASETQCLPKVTTSSCNNDLDCGEPWHGRCSEDKKCACKENNIAINTSTCSPLLKGLCWRDKQCITNNTACVDYHCVCKEGYIAVANNLCVKAN